MNALISAFKNKQKIMFANEGRLLKKSFFGLIILALAFQTGEFGNIIRESMVDAYLAVSVFVGFTLMVFIGLDSLTKFDIHSFLEKHCFLKGYDLNKSLLKVKNNYFGYGSINFIGYNKILELEQLYLDDSKNYIDFYNRILENGIVDLENLSIPFN